MPANPRFKLFITHSHKDNAFAERLFADLRSRGLDGFFDIHSLKGGVRIAEEISKGLKECDVYIPILSSASLKSPWCREELSGAVTLSNLPKREGRPKIVSVLIEDCEDELPVPILNRLFFNFAGRYDEALKELLERGLGLGELQHSKPQDSLKSLLDQFDKIKPLKPPATPVAIKHNPLATISSIDTEYNVTRASETGILIRATFQITGYKGGKGRAVAYFYKASGDALADTDGINCTTDKKVSAGTDFSPGYEITDYNKLEIFMPCSQFHVPPGNNDLKYYVSVWDLENQAVLATSNWVSFYYNRPPIVLDKVWVDYDTVEKDEKGMLIHLKFEITGYKGKTCLASAYFYHADGSPLKDVDKLYASQDGQVQTSNAFTPEFDDTTFNDHPLFMPYTQLHTEPGKTDLNFQIIIWDHTRTNKLATSDAVSFWYKLN